MTMSVALHPIASVSRLYLADYIKNKEKGYNKLLKTLTKDQSKNHHTNQSREKT